MNKAELLNQIDKEINETGSEISRLMDIKYDPDRITFLRGRAKGLNDAYRLALALI